MGSCVIRAYGSEVMDDVALPLPELRAAHAARPAGQRCERDLGDVQAARGVNRETVRGQEIAGVAGMVSVCETALQPGLRIEHRDTGWERLLDATVHPRLVADRARHL